MPQYESASQFPAQEGYGLSNRNLTGVFFPPHVRQRIVERGGDQETITDRISQARQQHRQLRGDCALIGCSPVVIAEFRTTRAVVQSVLEPGMALKPGTPTVWA